ncbi:MAG TPA: YihY/virulence factor BrkB family protein, partial [Firmicutes bacterium]|nr:YihY/virulence factor BrkB family protein [Bacillota bacterium]
MKKTLLALGFGVWRQYQNDQVAIEAAALAYYLLFSFFPLLIFISSLLGAAHLLPETVLSNLQGILPGEVLELVQGYLQQINQETTKNILMVSLFFSVYFPFRAMSRVIRVINQAYQVCKDRSILSKLILILVFGVFLAVLVF